MQAEPANSDLNARRLDVLERRLTYRFAVIASRMGSALAPVHLERYGLSVAAWRVLAVIARYEPLSAKDLATLTSTDPFRVTRALTVLSRKRLRIGISNGLWPASGLWKARLMHGWPADTGLDGLELTAATSSCRDSAWPLTDRSGLAGPWYQG